ncbi:hypothetical protein B0J14DRAFT_691908 [Halenospora varia]|nr:hypothetical protein B0J14DRAFT_691908 [Halenospora varia]
MSSKYGPHSQIYPTQPRQHSDAPRTNTYNTPHQSRKSSLKVPFLLVFAYIAGVGIGVGHHFFNSFLDGRLADYQAWMIGAGTALAYAAKLCFALSIGIALTQHLWKLMRTGPFTLGAIDNLFDLKNDPTRLFKSELLVKAKIALLLAISIWILPLLPILAPGSISVKAMSNIRIFPDITIQTLNFTRSFSTTLTGNTSYTFNFAEIQGNGATFDRYTGPSSRATGLIHSTVYGGHVLLPSSPCGANCTFTQSFNGPAYKCWEIDYTRDVGSRNPFCRDTASCNADHFNAPTRNAFDISWYMGRNSSGDTCDGCEGKAWMDGKIWIEYQYLQPSYRIQVDYPPKNATPIPDSAFERHQILCESYNATYTLKRSYVDFQPNVEGEMKFLNPLNYTAQTFSGIPMDGSYAGFAIHELLYSSLSGMIGLDGHMRRIDTTGLGGTQLVDEQPFPRPNTTSYNIDNTPGTMGIQKPIRDLRTALERLHFNITVGMLTIPNLIYAQNETVSAQTTTFENRWTYNWIPLAAAYAGCALLNFLALIVGTMAIIDNEGRGVGKSGFLRIVMTTRNSTLDGIVGDRGRGDDDLQEEVDMFKVKLGELQDPRSGVGTGRIAFGMENEVLELRRR